MSLKLSSLRQRGDTIVEVMIVLAVLGLALSISYATATRSLSNTRQAQENSEASSLAQSQIEALRTMTVPGYSGGNIFQAGPFCVAPGATNYTVVVPPNGTCSANPRYSVAIKYSQLSSAPNPVGGKFTIVISWDDVSGEGTDTVTSVYRLYQ